MTKDLRATTALLTSRRLFCAGLSAAVPTLLHAAAPVGGVGDGTLPTGQPVLTPPRIVGPVPVTATSKPFGTTMEPGSYSAWLMKEKDYVEEEYFLFGHANVYGPGDTRGLSARSGTGKERNFATAKMKPLAGVWLPAMPYATRLLILRPRNKANFSGRVHLYAFHNIANKMPIERNLLENGDAIAGIEGCSGTRFGELEIPSGGIAQLHKFDLPRYRELALAYASPLPWPDLTPATLGEAYKNIDFGGVGRSSDIFMQEIYRSYAQGPDIVTQAAHALKNGHAGLPFGKKVRSIYSFAASGGTTFLQPYIQYHHEMGMLPGGKPPIDGYLLMVGMLPEKMPKGAVFTFVNSQADLVTVEKLGTKFPPDSDEPRVRVYEIPGTGHGISAPLPEVSAAQGSTQLRGSAAVVPHGIAGISERDAPPAGVVPYDKINAPIIWALWENMYDWVEKGLPMPRAPRIERDSSAEGGLALDENGAARGGLRTPWVDVPEGVYLPRISPKNPLSAGFRAFPEERIIELYGSRENYTKRVNEKIDEMIASRFVRSQHAALMRESA